MPKLKNPTSPYPFNKEKRKSEIKANFKIIAVLRFEKTYLPPQHPGTEYWDGLGAFWWRKQAIIHSFHAWCNSELICSLNAWLSQFSNILSQAVTKQLVSSHTKRISIDVKVRYKEPTIAIHQLPLHASQQLDTSDLNYIKPVQTYIEHLFPAKEGWSNWMFIWKNLFHSMEFCCVQLWTNKIHN